jgi:hypothetical protein
MRDALALVPDRSDTVSARISCAAGATDSAAWHATDANTASAAVESAELRGRIIPVSMQEIVIKAAFLPTKAILQRFTFPGETWLYACFSVLFRRSARAISGYAFMLNAQPCAQVHRIKTDARKPMQFCHRRRAIRFVHVRARSSTRARRRRMSHSNANRNVVRAHFATLKHTVRLIYIKRRKSRGSFSH